MKGNHGSTGRNSLPIHEKDIQETAADGSCDISIALDDAAGLRFQDLPRELQQASTGHATTDPRPKK